MASRAMDYSSNYGMLLCRSVGHLARAIGRRLEHARLLFRRQRGEDVHHLQRAAARLCGRLCPVIKLERHFRPHNLHALLD